MTKSLNFNQSVGEIVSFIGLKGKLKVRPASNNPELFLDIEDVLLKNTKASKGSHQNTEARVTQAEVKQAKVKQVQLVKDFFQIQLEEFDSRTEVEPYRGFEIFTDKSQVRDLASNQWWVSDLIGLQVYNSAGELIGTVCDAPGQHGEFLEIKKANDSNAGTAVISFVKELFPVVDLKNKRIEVIDLPGLFDIT